MQLRTRNSRSGRSRNHRNRASIIKSPNGSDSSSDDAGDFRDTSNLSDANIYRGLNFTPPDVSMRDIYSSTVTTIFQDVDHDATSEKSSASRAQSDLRSCTSTVDSGFISRSSHSTHDVADQSSVAGSSLNGSRPRSALPTQRPATSCHEAVGVSTTGESSSSSSLCYSSTTSSSSCFTSAKISNIRRTKHRIQESPQRRRRRWLRTAEALKKSGLLDITIKTAELMRNNQKLQKEIEKLQKETDNFVSSVLSNPQNQHLLENIQSPAQLYEVVVPGSQGLMGNGAGSNSSMANPPGFSYVITKSPDDKHETPDIVFSINEKVDTS